MSLLYKLGHEEVVITENKSNKKFLMKRRGQQEEIYVKNSLLILRAHVAIEYISCKHKLTKER